MGSTRKKNAGRKRTLKYGRRRNYKKGSFKNRVKMTIRNGGGMKGGMFSRFKDKNNFKNSDTEEKTIVKLERMYEKLQNESSKNKHLMLASWKEYISKLDEPKKSEMIRHEESVKAKYPHSTGRSPTRPAAAAASSASLDEDDEDELYRRMSNVVLERSKQTKEKYDSLFKEITGKPPSSRAPTSDAVLQRELDAIVNGTSSRKLTRAQEKELSEGLAALDLYDE